MEEVRRVGNHLEMGERKMPASQMWKGGQVKSVEAALAEAWG